MYSPGEKRQKVKKRLQKLQDSSVYENTRWGDETVEKLVDLALRGKIIRGSLLLDAYEILGGEDEPLEYAAAIELIHTGLLTHDDIIDGDSMRRGVKSIPAQYSSEFDDTELANHLAICAGDIAYFLAFKNISRSGKVDPEALSVLSSTFARVGMGEMEDITLSMLQDPEEEKIMEVYRNKTACYTFSLPLRLASILVRGRDSPKLDGIGKKMGVLYQVKDDHLELFSNSGKTGKSASDLEEKKRTLHTRMLIQETGISPDEIDGTDPERIVELMRENGVKQKMDQEIERRRKQVLEDISQLENSELSDLLEEVVELIVRRER